jgi:titin
VIAAVALVAGVVAIAGMAVAAVGAVPPEPPTDVHVAVTPGPSEQVTFTPPVNDGGDPISSYTASCTSDSGGAARSATGKASPITVSGLSYGQTYTCNVTATNKDGTSVESLDSNAFVPITVASAPRSPTAVPYGPKTARVIWNAPESSGGSAITGYVITPYLGSTAEPVRTYKSPATTQLVNGLLTGRIYSFTVAAVNGAGTGPASAKTHPVPMGAPGQPQNVKAVRTSAGALQVTYLPPANNGATITSFTAGCNSTNGGVNRTKTKTAPPSAITVTGLTAGKKYTCAVKATNNRGSGPRSSATPEVTA